MIRYRIIERNDSRYEVQCKQSYFSGWDDTYFSSFSGYDLACEYIRSLIKAENERILKKQGMKTKKIWYPEL